MIIFILTLISFSITAVAFITQAGASGARQKALQIVSSVGFVLTSLLLIISVFLLSR